MSIALIDTSVFCHIIPVPGFDQHREAILAQLDSFIQADTTLLLPMPAVIETGNHIAYVPNGYARRKAAQQFCLQVENTIDGSDPWTQTPFWEVGALRNWLHEFPGSAMRGAGMGDLSIIKEWERQCVYTKPAGFSSGAWTETT